MAPSLLIVGLPTRGIPDPALFERITKGIEELKVILPTAGYEYEVLETPPIIGSQQATESITSRKWDAIIIGFGVRAMPEHTAFFEWLVNEIKEKAPQAKIGFNVDPQSTLDSAKRLVPV